MTFQNSTTLLARIWSKMMLLRSVNQREMVGLESEADLGASISPIFHQLS